jgi:transcriptional regulator with XRE-family HTH domain
MGNSEPTGRDLVPGFAEMIRSACEAKEWSLNDLARAAGVSANTVSAVTREIRAPSLRVASALVSALGLMVWLHAPADPVGPPTAKPAEPAAAEKPAAKGKGKK